MFRLPKFRRPKPPPDGDEDPHSTPSWYWDQDEMLELYRYALQELEDGKMDPELWQRATSEAHTTKGRTEWYLGARTTRLREIAEAQLRKEGIRPARRR